MPKKPTTIYVNGKSSFKITILNERTIVMPKFRSIANILRSSSYLVITYNRRKLLIEGRGAIRYLLEKLVEKNKINLATKEHVYCLLGISPKPQRKIPSGWAPLSACQALTAQEALGRRDIDMATYNGRDFLLHPVDDDRASAEYEAFFMALLKQTNHYTPEPVIFHKDGKRIYIGSEYIQDAKPLGQVLLELMDTQEHKKFVLRIASQLGKILTLAKLFKEVDLNTDNILVIWVNKQPILIWIDHDYTFFPEQCKYQNFHPLIHDKQFPTSPSQAYPKTTHVVSATSVFATSYDHPFNWIVRWNVGAKGHFKRSGYTSLSKLFLLLPGIDSAPVRQQLKQGNAAALYSLAIIPPEQIEALANTYMRSPRATKKIIRYFNGLIRDIWPVFFADPILMNYYRNHRLLIVNDLTRQIETYNKELKSSQSHLMRNLEVSLKRLPKTQDIPSYVRQGISRYFYQLDCRLHYLTVQIENVCKISIEHYDSYIIRVVKLMEILADEEHLLLLIAQEYVGQRLINDPLKRQLGSIKTVVELYQKKVQEFKQTIHNLMPEDFFTRAKNIGQYLEKQFQYIPVLSQNKHVARKPFSEQLSTLYYLMRLTVNYYMHLEKYSYLELKAIEIAKPSIGSARSKLIRHISSSLGSLQSSIEIFLKDASFDKQKGFTHLRRMLLKLKKLEKLCKKSLMQMKEFDTSMTFLRELLEQLKPQPKLEAVTNSGGHQSLQLFQTRKRHPVKLADKPVLSITSSTDSTIVLQHK